MTEATSHPSGDQRFTVLDTVMKRHRFRPDTLIEVLHTAQDLFGFLALDVLCYIAHGLKVPPSRVYGVATFYHLFSLKPQGEHTCIICMGTACFVDGADRLLTAVQTCAGIQVGQTTPDNKLSLGLARCIGACSLAPIVIFDGRTASHQTADLVVDKVREWLENGCR
jgi:bidirectional [NiFe] hydrogenase diaphorase subunit